MDENVDGAITRRLLRDGIDVVRIQDFPEVYQQPDEVVLAWTTAQGRVLVTKDRKTMEHARQYQLQRIGACSPIVYLRHLARVGLVIDDLQLLNECSNADDWAGGVMWVPIP